ncbi:MAG: dihydropteroate synthase [Planctomycetes bacterium]|nr:dihydropteroate synthase [Planctomycetota bacterium]
MEQQHIHFVTGRLAQHALESIVPSLAAQVGFQYSIDVLPITVAALMTPAWIAKRIQVPDSATRVLIPGYCGGDLEPLEAKLKLSVERGPRDLRQLPNFFSRDPLPLDYGSYDIEILAEINHCPQLSRKEILREAAALRADGANWIDVGCEPGDAWSGVGEVVRALCDEGHRVSIDSLNPREIEPAVRAGAELVLSVNSSNREAAVDWGVEVIAIPDQPKGLVGLDETIDFLAQAGVPLRIDPILEPIAFGFAPSLGRYLDVRRRYPDAEIMMGIGNLTELTDVDSAGINTLLLGFCQELGIRSVLTTQVINWARSSVRECDLARRLMFHAVNESVPPKHLEPKLLMLRDEQIVESSSEQIAQLATDVRDNNYRIFAAAGEVHLVSRNLHLHDADPFVIMQQLRDCDADHAFYLGYEMCKALTAITLGKTYEQDESLDWGLATRPEQSHRLKRTRRSDAP